MTTPIVSVVRTPYTDKGEIIAYYPSAEPETWYAKAYYEQEQFARYEGKSAVARCKRAITRRYKQKTGHVYVEPLPDIATSPTPANFAESQGEWE